MIDIDPNWPGGAPEVPEEPEEPEVEPPATPQPDLEPDAEPEELPPLEPGGDGPDVSYPDGLSAEQ